MEPLPPVLEPYSPQSSSPMPLASKLANVFAAPGEVFDEVRSAPVSNANWVMPGVLLVLISWLGAWLVFSQPSIQQQLKDISDRAVDKQVQASHLSEQQAEQARAMGAKLGNIGAYVGAFGSPLFMAFVTPLWWGFLLWLIGAKICGTDMPYMKGVEIAGLAGMISVLDAVIRPLLILLTGNVFAAPGLSLLVKDFDPQNPVHGLLSAVNIITFWVLATRAVGLARVGRLSYVKAVSGVFGVWLLLTGFIAGCGFAVQHLFTPRT